MVLLIKKTESKKPNNPATTNTTNITTITMLYTSVYRFTIIKIIAMFLLNMNPTIGLPFIIISTLIVYFYLYFLKY